MLKISQIINLKMAGGVSGLIMSYQCGETLVPVVKDVMSKYYLGFKLR